MPSQTTAPPLTVTVLAALWVSLGRCGVSDSPGPGCDNGKLSLDRDLPVGTVHWDCPMSAWPGSSQRPPGIDTVYNPEPARQICMDASISYSHTIPSSGAYRPVQAESGEYLYCPPQRWLKNLHHGATVLLHHPCAPLRERLLLSVLARSCLPDYIMTPHLQLSRHRPIALVSWGRTLELSTVASSGACDWLENTTSARNDIGGANQSRKYNLLLTWSAEQRRQRRALPEETPATTQGSLRRCCEQTIASLLNWAMEVEPRSDAAVEGSKLIQEEGKSRRRRAAIRGQQGDVTDVNERQNPTTAHFSRFLTNPTNRTTLSRTRDPTLGSSADSPPGNWTLSGPPGPRVAPSQSQIQNTGQGLTPRPKTPSGVTLTLQTAVQQPRPTRTDIRSPHASAGLDVLSDGERNHTARPEALALSSKDSAKERHTDSVKHSMKKNDSKVKPSDRDSAAGGPMKDHKAVDVKERELEQKQTHGGARARPQGEKTGFDSVSKSPAGAPPRQRPNPQPTGELPSSHDCDGCTQGQPCECSKDSGDEAEAGPRAAVVNTGLPRTPRTDEAVWAAAALGFLLVLLTLSVLHTRLYRHWRTTPSLYWHDPQQDYDSVADVIRRRLRIAKRRRKRGRRQECVLLPSSSSSDEHP